MDITIKASKLDGLQNYNGVDKKKQTLIKENGSRHSDNLTDIEYALYLMGFYPLTTLQKTLIERLVKIQQEAKTITFSNDGEIEVLTMALRLIEYDKEAERTKAEYMTHTKDAYTYAKFQEEKAFEKECREVFAAKDKARLLSTRVLAVFGDYKVKDKVGMALFREIRELEDFKSDTKINEAIREIPPTKPFRYFTW